MGSVSYTHLDVYKRQNLDSIIQEEIGLVFAQVLEDAGVYKRTAEGQAAFDRFLRHCGAEI